MISLGFAGCGDVAFRTYFPVLPSLEEQGLARVVGCFDPRAPQAERAAALFDGARAYGALSDLLAHDGLDAVVNLTPAPVHREVNTAILEAGKHLFSEKPLAGSVAEAQDLIALAERQGRLLLCAPAVMVARRFAWLRELIAAGRIGRPTLAVGQMANMGPAAWRGYTGDPAVFYGPSVGPLLDTGVYILHAITGLLGPARRVLAMGGVAIPHRQVLIPGREGETVEVTANDQMLVQLDLGETTFAQMLSSFAVPASAAPALEIHGTAGSLSISLDTWYDANGGTDIFQTDQSPLGLAGWLRNVVPPDPSPYTNLIGAGIPHFVGCLLGDEEPVPTAAHATHVLEIIDAATRSAAEGRAIALATTF